MFYLRIFLIFLFLFFAELITYGSQNYRLNGTITGLESGKMYLIKYINSVREIDSSFIRYGKFELTGIINGYNEQVYLKLDKNQKNNTDSLNSVNIFIDNSNMQISLVLNSFSKFILKNCNACDDLIKYQKSLIYSRRNNKLFDEKIFTFQYLRNNNVKNALPYLLYKCNWNFEQLKILKLHYNKMDEYQKKSYYGQKIKDEIDRYENISLFTKKSIDSFFIQTNQLKSTSVYDIFSSSKLSLLVFWGSWCIPCRKENKDLIKLKKMYGTSLEIITIACEDEIEDWQLALKTDCLGTLINTHEKDFVDKGKNKIKVMDYFNIEYFPTIIILNYEGYIKAIIEGSDIKKLKMVLKKLVQ